MKTGIVRRIDDLGRIVIPKEIRRKLGIHDGDPLELEIDGDKIVLARYFASEEYLPSVKALISELENEFELPQGTRNEAVCKLREAYEILRKGGNES